MLSLAAGIAVSTVAAKSYEDRYVASYGVRADIPVPVKVIVPELPHRVKSAVIEVKFTVDESGVPRDIAVTESGNASLEDSLLHAVNQWRFRPLLRDGKAVSTTVILPVRIVRYGDAALASVR